MTVQPVLKRLAVGRFGKGVVRGTQHGNKHLGLSHLPRGGTDDGQGRAAVVDEALLACFVRLTHGAGQSAAPFKIAVAELGIAVAAVRVLSGVLLLEATAW